MSNISGSLDANVLLRLVIPDIPKQTAAALGLFKKDRRYQVADVAIIETIFALERYYEVPRAEVVEIIKALIGNSQLTFNRALFSDALEIYEQHLKLSIEDCCLATYAKLNEALPLWTFDKKLAKQVSEFARLAPAD